MTLTSVKRIAVACVVSSAVFAGAAAVDARGGAQLAGGDVQGAAAQAPPSMSPLALASRVASEDLLERFQNLQANHDIGRLNATQTRNANRAAQALFAATHPQLAESFRLPAAKLSERAPLVPVAVYTDWYLTKDDNAWLGVEWWYDNEVGDWFGFTLTWDPRFGNQYGDQYLYYNAGTYYGFYYWE